jgi:anaerobic magnesium-protoporphyrin IX monomethyl ester cyclase
MHPNQSPDIDLLLINPHGRDSLYQELGRELAAVEPPLWWRLIGGSVRDRGYGVAAYSNHA